MDKETLIRDAIVSALTGLTTTGTSVAIIDVYNIEEVALPHLVVKTDVSASDVVSQGNGQRVYQNVLSVSIEGIASATSGLKTLLDTIYQEVNTAMHSDITFGGLALNTARVSRRKEMEKASRPVGRLFIDYDITYVTEE